MVIISTAHTAYGAYRYMGCYQQVLYDSYFTSSYMEPNLCFRLCETPIVFIQGTMCRCSGSGIMHYDRHEDRDCPIQCRKPGDYRVKTDAKCGGAQTYSAYAEEDFYTRHAYLLEYRIQYESCQFWNRSDYYDTFQVKTDGLSTKSPLTRLERCAATCLDRNSTTISIAFNDDNNQCSCIMPKESNENSDRSSYLAILPNDKCDRYCENIVGDSKVKQKFQCGSLTNERIWAIYKLNDLCPADSVYIKELKQCMFTEKIRTAVCSSPAMKYVYDGNVTWDMFLKVIKKLNLTKSIVSVDFDDVVIIDSSWKCQTNTTDNRTKSNISNMNYSTGNFTTNYVLKNGCLRENSYTLSSHISSNRLCITYAINKKSPLDDILISFNSYYRINQMGTSCMPNWFDLNGNCYRMSNEAKTIQKAKNSCINISEFKKEISLLESHTALDDDDDDDEDRKKFASEATKFISEYLTGEIAQYTSRWQTHLGFYLLDTNASNVEENSDSFPIYVQSMSSLPVKTQVSPLILVESINSSSISEFQMINSNENNNSTIGDDSCIVVTRPVLDQQGISILKTTQIHNCSRPVHVLCKSRTKISIPFRPVCYDKPLTLGLPAMISNYLTHELCLSVCKELTVDVAVVQMNKCYCLNSFLTHTSRIISHHEKYRKEHCGNPCPGNQHEYCGNNNTVVAMNIKRIPLSFRYSTITQLTPSYPDFIYDTCLHVDTAAQSKMFQFYLNYADDVHPRHCLELCTKYEQKYALLNAKKCLCSNIRIKKRETDSWLLPRDNNCTEECLGNYFYSCGNISESSVYSVYSLQKNCPVGFRNAQDDQRCVRAGTTENITSFSNAQSSCESFGGMIAKINDALEIQHLAPKSTLTGGNDEIWPYSSASRIPERVHYFWIDRTSSTSNKDATLDFSIPKCSMKTSESVDRHCIAVIFEKTITHDTVSYDPCIIESNECSSTSAVPVCVDKNLKSDPTFIHSTEVGDDSVVSVNTTIEYSCGGDKEYHLVNGFCYKIIVHETTWQEAKSQCERENAALFIPENVIAIKLIKLLFLREQSYTSSGFAHVGVTYDNKNSTIKKSNTNNASSVLDTMEITSPYFSCESTFLRHYRQLMSSSILSTKEKERLKNEQTACAYVDVRSEDRKYVLCDDIRCDRSATVICQKAPITKARTVVAKSSPMNMQFNFHASSKPVGTRFPLALFLSATLFIAILTGSIYLLYNRYLKQKNNTRLRTARDNDDSVYSPLATGNDFDLH
ncbi:unnamed protein product [Rotaria socialis]|uniref:WSC domain-containing protein n=2 Tax=Rotaria socialis TaxID=392032 RepID=A0A820WLI2_9BILA|nr:unnamed protein product [Rotaria socialis]CAF4517867.1 unnamed protein product [Rotaria socialis]